MSELEITPRETLSNSSKDKKITPSPQVKINPLTKLISSIRDRRQLGEVRENLNQQTDDNPREVPLQRVTPEQEEKMKESLNELKRYYDKPSSQESKFSKWKTSRKITKFIDSHTVSLSHAINNTSDQTQILEQMNGLVGRYGTNVEKKIATFYHANIGRLNEILTRESNIQNDALRAFQIMFTKGTLQTKHEALDVVHTNLNILQERNLIADNAFFVVNLVSQTEAKDIAIKRKAETILSDLFQNAITLDSPTFAPNTIAKIYCDTLIMKQKDASRIVTEQMQVFLNNYGLSFTDTLRAWQLSDDFLPRAMERNITSMVKLEKEKPGIVSMLQQNYGIFNFGRYPEAALIRQYEQHDTNDQPYGLVVFPREDKQFIYAPFYSMKDTLGSLYSELHDPSRIKEYELRIMEAETTRDLVHGINIERHRHGKVSFLILGGHGTENSIRFGEKGEITTANIVKDDKVSTRVQALSLAFEPDASLILFSCSNGAQGGIAENIHEHLGIEVIAPPVDSMVRGIRSKQSATGRLSFDVTYQGTQQRKLQAA